MRRLKQALWRFIEPARRKVNGRIEELAFRASVRAIEETHWLARQTADDSATRAIHQALAAYTPPTPWAEAWVDEVTQVLDSVIAEQFRLQSQVEELQHLLREAVAGRVATADD